MDRLATIEIKAFVPARDYALSRRFYADIGFEEKSEGDGVAYFAAGECSFLLQDFYRPGHADNFVMHLLVADVDAWHQHLRNERIVERYDIRLDEPEDRPWRMRDFCMTDPSGVLWRIAQNLGGRPLADG
ncbi:VOC family protein [Dyella ginsengisoli]|jgi:catechol 2,3-dioxygenase-like lactoylglutathione lyase family enzyme|uniref:VOC family protein n=1 Tax=Dyella ginsengisoli TaxID=363848 RepID=A0ABW8JTJ6_9GAMM